MSNPSLILPQSPAYGEDYVYAAQVEDGAVPLYNVLPLTFTRASGGTRINKDGLVQNMPYNLASYSEDFSNGFWTQNNCTVTANNTTAPNGTLTADLITSTGTLETGVYYFPSVIGTNTWSVYAKKGTGRYLFFNTNNPPNIAAKFDLQDGVIVGTPLAGATPSIESVGNGWYRCIITANTATNRFTVFITNNTTTNDLTSSVGLSYYLWGAQLNIGSTAQPYLATTDRLNMPRITYPVGGGCGALLLEKQSTNVVFPSEDFSTTWSLYNSATITTNQTTSPDGTQNADKLTTANSANALYNVNGAGTSSGDYTVSIFVKPINNNSIGLGMTDDTTGEAYVLVDVATGSGTTTTQTSNWTNVSFTWSPYGNGWYRITLTATKGSTGNARFIVKGNSSSQYYIWGAQLEASSYATSYIPTTSTSATRIQDVCYKTGISNLIGQTQGTLFVDVDFKYNNETTDKDTRIWSTWDNSYIKVISIWARDNALRYQVYDAATSLNIENSITASQGRHKVALAYNGTSLIVYMDGSLVINTTMPQNAPATSRAGFAYFWNLNMIHHSIGINNAQLYNIALSTSELATLTS